MRARDPRPFSVPFGTFFIIGGVVPLSPLLSLDVINDPDNKSASPNEWDRESYRETIVPFIDPSGSRSDANPLLESGSF